MLADFICHKALFHMIVKKWYLFWWHMEFCSQMNSTARIVEGFEHHFVRLRVSRLWVSLWLSQLPLSIVHIYRSLVVAPIRSGNDAGGDCKEDEDRENFLRMF